MRFGLTAFVCARLADGPAHMMGELFAVGNAVAQAGSNVIAGAAVRRSNPIAVLVVATPVTVALAVAIALPGGRPATGLPLVWGALAGLLGGIGLLLSYRAFTLGRVAVVVPVTTCAVTVVQVGAGWLLEGPPPLGTVAGALVCLLSVVVISRQRGEPGAGVDPVRAVLFALAAGVCFAGFAVLLSQGADASPMWALVAARVGVMVVVLGLALFLRSRSSIGRTTVGLAVLAGLLDLAANLLLLAALSAASLAVVAAVVAIAPVIAVVLAVAFLGERLQLRQIVGLLMCLGGVWLVVLV